MTTKKNIIKMPKREIKIKIAFQIERKYPKEHSEQTELLIDRSSKFKFYLLLDFRAQFYHF